MVILVQSLQVITTRKLVTLLIDHQSRRLEIICSILIKLLKTAKLAGHQGIINPKSAAPILKT